MTYKIVSIYFLYQYMVDLRKKITSWIVLHSICFNTEQKKKSMNIQLDYIAMKC